MIRRLLRYDVGHADTTPRITGSLGPRTRLHGHVEFYGASDDAESIATIHRALELGGDFLDTADMYGPFTNEDLVGKAIAGGATTS